MERSSPKLIDAIALLSFGSSLLVLLRCFTCNIKIKKQNMKGEKGEEFTSWFIVVWDGETSTWKWRKITYYIYPKNYFMQEMKFQWEGNFKYLLLACTIAFVLLCYFKFIQWKDCCRLFILGFSVVSLYSYILGWKHALSIKKRYCNLNLYYLFKNYFYFKSTCFYCFKWTQ